MDTAVPATEDSSEIITDRLALAIYEHKLRPGLSCPKTRWERFTASAALWCVRLCMISWSL